jgi:pimeloyl-ACP methyl ester carboxylesterase
VITPVCPIEYVDQGSGYPLLLVHGIFGGHDAALRLAEPEVLAGYRVIAPSRFGYLGTPMPAQPSAALQGDAHAALLDALGVDQAFVFAASAGVTSALQMAIRYPSRVTGLVLQSSNVPGPHQEKQLLPRGIAARVWRSNLLMWLIRTYFSGAIAHSMMGVPKQLPLSDTDQARLEEELDSIFPVDLRINGVLFDAYVGNPEINNAFASTRSPRLPSLSTSKMTADRHTPGPSQWHSGFRTLRSSPGNTAVTWASVSTRRYRSASRHSCVVSPAERDEILCMRKVAPAGGKSRSRTPALSVADHRIGKPRRRPIRLPLADERLKWQHEG